MGTAMITLEDVKSHLRLDLEADSELDPQLEAMLAAAMDHASQYLNRPVPWDDAEGKPVFPDSVRAAVLLIVGDLHENREGVVAGVSLARNPTVDRLLHFYRVGLGV
ncbi:MAG: head-tail connector protein [Pseudomonas sp.]|nr:head-tail connector protein [Pseudomonas sp.]